MSNLSPDKPTMYVDKFRVLKPGGRLAISDLVASAAMVDEVEAMLATTGFEQVRVVPKDESKTFRES